VDRERPRVLPAPWSTGRSRASPTAIAQLDLSDEVLAAANAQLQADIAALEKSNNLIPQLRGEISSFLAEIDLQAGSSQLNTALKREVEELQGEVAKLKNDKLPVVSALVHEQLKDELANTKEHRDHNAKVIWDCQRENSAQREELARLRSKLAEKAGMPE
jgi:chromosome segregation ATPase